MRNQLVYDLPQRLFHWIFAGLFISAFLIAKNVDDESLTFSYHMLAGFMLSFVVFMRLVWGFVGPKNSRFSSFALHPKDLKNYFVGILSGEKRKSAGHNPASSWAALAMFGFALGLGATGYLMATGQKETFEDVHELLANGFLVTVLLHIAGVVLHMFRHRDGIAFSMLDGAKSGVSPADAIVDSRPFVGFLFLALVGFYGLYLANNFNSQTRVLNLFGKQLQLGEGEGQGGGKENHSLESNDEDHDED